MSCMRPLLGKLVDAADPTTVLVSDYDAVDEHREDAVPGEFARAQLTELCRGARDRPQTDAVGTRRGKRLHLLARGIGRGLRDAEQHHGAQV